VQRAFNTPVLHEFMNWYIAPVLSSLILGVIGLFLI